MYTRIFASEYVNIDAKEDGSLLLTWNVEGYRGCKLTDPNKSIDEGVRWLVKVLIDLADRFYAYEKLHRRNGCTEKAEAFGKAAFIASFDCPLDDIVVLAMIEYYGRKDVWHALHDVPAWKVASAFFTD